VHPGENKGGEAEEERIWNLTSIAGGVRPGQQRRELAEADDRGDDEEEQEEEVEGEKATCKAMDSANRWSTQRPNSNLRLSVSSSSSFSSSFLLPSS
jgi:hypothetical protein